MTTDVVVLLRLADFIGEDTTTLKIAVEAADEIERLREEVAYLKQGWYPTPATVQSYPWWRKKWS